MTAPIGCLDGEQIAAGRVRMTLVAEIMRYVDAYAYDYKAEGKLANSRRGVESAILAALSASRQEGWISVEERMPPPTTYVIAHGRRYGDWEGHKRVYVTYTGTRVFETVEDEEIAYWMPLPTPPRSES